MRKAEEVRQAARSDSKTSSMPSAASFDRCLVDGDTAAVSRSRTSRRKALGLSVVIESLLLAAVILAPLLTTVAQPQLHRDSVVPIPIIGRRTPDLIRRPATPTRPSGYSAGQLTFLAAPRHPTSPIPTEPDDPTWVDGVDVYQHASGLGDQAFADFDRYQLNIMVPPPMTVHRDSPRAPVKMSEGVEEAQLISRVEPRYPPLAMQIHLEGTVRLHAIISREGSISSLEVVSGHPLLVQAALDAVRQWRYHPTMLDGDPVDVETTITVTFQLRH